MKTRLNDLFDQMDKEEGNKLDDKIKIEEGACVYEILNAVNEFNDESMDRYSMEGRKFLDNIFLNKYSSKTITKFSALASKDIVEKKLKSNFGYFLNYLVNRSPDQNHHIKISVPSSLIPRLGSFNKKNIIVDGDVGQFFGAFMQSGKIVLNGNAEEYACFKMSGGEIIINGNVNICFATDMAGGKITVNGNLGHIYLPLHGGDIYHYDKQIVKNGKFLDRSYKKYDSIF